MSTDYISSAVKEDERELSFTCGIDNKIKCKKPMFICVIFLNQIQGGVPKTKFLWKRFPEVFEKKTSLL